MTVEGIAEILSAKVLVPGSGRTAGCLACDIMSRAMAQGFRGMVWITHRPDMNALAVAVMKGAACMVFPEGIRPEADVIRRAEIEKMPLLTTALSAFEAAGRLYAAGLGGEEN